MKKTFRIVPALTALLLILSMLLAGCGSRRDVSGTYRAAYDMRDVLNNELADAGIAVSGEVSADFILQLNEDKTFTFDIDGDGFSRSFTEIIQTEGRSIIDAMMAEQGVTEDMYEMIASYSGYDSYDAFVEDMIGMIREKMGGDFVTELESATHLEGTYEVSKDTLTLKAEVSGEESIDSGTINEDGTIRVVSAMDDGTALDLTFSKQQ